MRVLHVSPYFAPAFCYGGPPRTVFGLCQGLQHAGIDLEVFTTTANGSGSLVAAPDGVLYEGVPVRYFPLGFPRRYWRSPALERAIQTAARSADLIHVHGLWNFTGWSGVRAARAAGKPYVISPRGMLQAGARAHRRVSKSVAFAAIERNNLRRAAFLHATSEEEANRLAGLHVPVVLIRNGVAAVKAADADRRRVVHAANIPEGASIVLVLGRIHPIKRLDLVADAFVQVRRSTASAFLVVAGSDEQGHRESIEKRLAAVTDHVRFVGPVDGADKAAWLSAATTLVQCSDSESFGMSVAEALTAGTPVIVTDRSPWRDVQSAGCGFVTTHGADAIAAALQRVLLNPLEASMMRSRAAEWAAGRFGWTEIGREMAGAYRVALARIERAA